MTRFVNAQPTVLQHVLSEGPRLQRPGEEPQQHRREAFDQLDCGGAVSLLIALHEDAQSFGVMFILRRIGLSSARVTIERLTRRTT